MKIKVRYGDMLYEKKTQRFSQRFFSTISHLLLLYVLHTKTFLYLLIINE